MSATTTSMLPVPHIACDVVRGGHDMFAPGQAMYESSAGAKSIQTIYAVRIDGLVQLAPSVLPARSCVHVSCILNTKLCNSSSRDLVWLSSELRECVNILGQYYAPQRLSSESYTVGSLKIQSVGPTSITWQEIAGRKG